MTTLPTLSQLYNGILTDLESEYGVTISLIMKVALRAIAAVQAGKLWLLYKYVGSVQKNVWPDTADPESTGGTLERFGRVRLNRNPRAAVSGQYRVSVAGTIGAVIPAQSVFKSDDGSLHAGFLFILDNAHSLLTATSDTIILRALTAGVEAKLAVGNTLTATSPLADVNNQVTVTVEEIQPLAGETIPQYRADVVQSFRLEAQGGADADYRIWAADAQGVAQVYPYAKPSETNAVNVYVEATTADSIDGMGTPSQAILDDVESVINFNPDTTLPLNERGRKPATVRVYPLAITPKNVDITITGFGGTATQKTLITNAIRSFLNTVRPFVAAADVEANKNDIVSTNNLNGVIFSQIPAAVYTAITLQIAGIAVSSYTFNLGNIPNLNSVTFN